MVFFLLVAYDRLRGVWEAWLDYIGDDTDVPTARKIYVTFAQWHAPLDGKRL
ncbi:MAG: hypothetical protein N3E49_02980 [Bacteroidia bacterium]|nr:hypothetical protein [Bacteroidia bacterium]